MASLSPIMLGYVSMRVCMITFAPDSSMMMVRIWIHDMCYCGLVLLIEDVILFQ